MTTMTLPKHILDKYQADERRERAEARTAAIAELQRVDAELFETTKAQDAKVAEARSKLPAAQQAVRDAETSLKAAELARRAAILPGERQRDSLRHRLETSLRPDCLIDVLAEIDALADKLRDVPADAGHETYKSAVESLAWTQQARESLLNLQFADVDVSKAIAKILASRPS